MFSQLSDGDRVLLKLEVPTGLFIRRRVFCVLWEIVKVSVVQRSVHLVEEHRLMLTLSSVYCYHIEILKDTHCGCEWRGYGSLAEAVPVEALKPPEGQGHVVMTTVLYLLQEALNLMISIFTASLVFLDILHSIFLISEPL